MSTTTICNRCRVIPWETDQLWILMPSNFDNILHTYSTATIALKHESELYTDMVSYGVKHDVNPSTSGYNCKYIKLVIIHIIPK